MKSYVQLDGDGSAVLAVFGAPQDPEAWPGYAEVESDDPRLLEFLSGLPQPIEGQ